MRSRRALEDSKSEKREQHNFSDLLGIEAFAGSECLAYHASVDCGLKPFFPDASAAPGVTSWASLRVSIVSTSSYVWLLLLSITAAEQGCR